jgi:threonine/homoserine/homoserine lactone efflux protein
VTRSLLAFAVFAAVLTVTPGLDTVLVLRMTVRRGRRAGLSAMAGIALGCLCWALASVLGITALLAASRLAYDVLRWAGVGYLCWLGFRALWNARRPAAAGENSTVDYQPAGAGPGTGPGSASALRTGLLTNLLNPKVGAFYLSVLPQFLPHDVPPLLGGIVLSAVHVIEGGIWLSILVVVAARAGRWLRRPAVQRRFDQVTGVVFLGFGVRLAVEGAGR